MEAARKVDNEVAGKVAASIANQNQTLIVSGDCTVEIGTVAGVRRKNSNVGFEAHKSARILSDLSKLK